VIAFCDDTRNCTAFTGSGNWDDASSTLLEIGWSAGTYADTYNPDYLQRPRFPKFEPKPRPPRVLGRPRLALAWPPLPRARRSTHKPRGVALTARMPRRRRRF
jgi:hypothetical protein